MFSFYELQLETTKENDLFFRLFHVILGTMIFVFLDLQGPSFRYVSDYPHTTNKAQIQSFGDSIGIGLDNECFSHFQLYFAMSSDTHLSSILLFRKHPGEEVTNVLYFIVLSYH